MSKVKLVNITPNAEETMAYVARVSSKNQDNKDYSRLLRYCAQHNHWSVFEQAFMTVEVVCPLAIAVQMIRHRSFSFQVFSGRYQDQTVMSEVTEGINTVYKDIFYIPEVARLQDKKNRQNSIITDDKELYKYVKSEIEGVYDQALKAYENLLNAGVAKEIARFVLPQGVFTRLYMSGSVRSFIHYIQVREEEGVVQQEHVEVALALKSVFIDNLPTVAGALDWC